MNPVDIITQALHVDRRMARFILGGLTLLAAAAIVISWDYDIDKLVRVGVFILAFCVAIVVLANVRGVISLVAAWLIFGVGVIYIALGSFQFLTQSSLTPPAPPFFCFVSPLDPRCTQLADSVAATTEPAVLARATPPAPTSATRAPTLPANLRTGASVYIQFAGSVAREDMIAFATRLAGQGWAVPGADRGGERLKAAAGLNEVRFFHAEDKAVAEQLARDASAGNPLGSTVKVRSLVYANLEAPKRQLELWLSN